MKPIGCRGVVAVAALALLVGACSSGGDRAAVSPTRSPWLAVAQGKVGVEGGMVLVATRADGVVESVMVKQGDVVRKGQVLATLDPRAAKIAVASAQAGVDGAKARLDELRVTLNQAGQRAPRIAAAAAAGAAAGEAAEQARDKLAVLKAEQVGARAALNVAQQKLAGAQLNLDMATLRAPVAGVIVLRRVAVGQTVSAASGQPLFELLPDRPHVVQAQVDVDAAGAIHVGMRAEVIPDSGAGPVYHATVLWVGQVLRPASLTGDPLARALANDVDCTLELAAPRQGEVPLRIGQRVLVRFPRSGP